MSFLAFFLPYEASPTVIACCGLAALAYLRGQARGAGGGAARSTAFWLGLALIYAALQTQYDYYALHMFFLHRLQHLGLHHVGPFLIVLAAPGATLLAGAPEPVRRYIVTPLARNRTLRALYRGVQQPAVAGFLFVGLIYFWLIPPLHFIAMLNVPLYNAMNWGMAIDGLLFWWVALGPRPEGVNANRFYSGRFLLLTLVMLAQIPIGARIALSRSDLFSVYEACGRVWPIESLTDQQIGGVITWIPPAMMSVIGMLVLLRRWAQEEAVVGRGERTCGELA
ncbi:cytochrome c oxidase assembly protein [Rhodoblastus sp.]|uniref:cytochrome c oxidase assembly protein n=1 Tax=Rhodoblastus sp. TaxID=1962975 RepID=UPI0026261F0D|nr:cytochrome c oxidase assembly protein [Rhodoblastus sp.]